MDGSNEGMKMKRRRIVPYQLDEKALTKQQNEMFHPVMHLIFQK